MSTNKEAKEAKEAEDIMVALINRAARASVMRHFGRFMKEVFESDHPGVTEYTNEDLKSHFLASSDKTLLPLKKVFMAIKKKNCLAWRAGDLILSLDKVLRKDVPYDLEWESDVKIDFRLYLASVEETDTEEETNSYEVMGSDVEMDFDEVEGHYGIEGLGEMDARDENQSYKSWIV